MDPSDDELLNNEIEQDEEDVEEEEEEEFEPEDENDESFGEEEKYSNDNGIEDIDEEEIQEDHGDDDEDFIDEPVKKKKKVGATTNDKIKSNKKSPKKKTNEKKLNNKTISKTKKKVSSSSTPITEEKAEEEVLNYLKKTNRPYSVINVFDNLHKRISKSVLTVILDNLVEKQELVSKIYGKSKIYYYNQHKLPVPDKEEINKIDEEIKKAEEDVVILENKLKKSENELQTLKDAISDKDLQNTLIEKNKKYNDLIIQIKELEEKGREPVSPEKKSALLKKFNTLKSEWIKRKRIVMDAVNQIAEGMEKKTLDIIEMCNIETDEEVGVTSIPSF